MFRRSIRKVLEQILEDSRYFLSHYQRKVDKITPNPLPAGASREVISFYVLSFSA
jgi:hypothetical protein